MAEMDAMLSSPTFYGGQSPGGSTPEVPGGELYAVNGMDLQSDLYNGSRRTATVRLGQGPMAALADQGLNAAQ